MREAVRVSSRPLQRDSVQEGLCGSTNPEDVRLEAAAASRSRSTPLTAAVHHRRRSIYVKRELH